MHLFTKKGRHNFLTVRYPILSITSENLKAKKERKKKAYKGRTKVKFTCLKVTRHLTWRMTFLTFASQKAPLYLAETSVPTGRQASSSFQQNNFYNFIKNFQHMARVSDSYSFDTDPDSAFLAEYRSESNRIRGFYDQKLKINLELRKNFFVDQTLQFTYPQAKLQKKPSDLKREHTALQNMKFFPTFRGHFCPPGSGSGNGPTDQIESGFGSEILHMASPVYGGPLL